MSATLTSRRAIVRYVASRLGQALIVLWAAYTVSFVVLYALPSDPVALLAGGDASDITPEQLDALTAQYGLDQPIVVQYLLRLGGVLTGDFGTSIASGRPVAQVIGEAIPPTLQLAGLGFALAVLTGAGLAVLATYVRSRALSSFLLGLPPLGVAIPSFWFGLMLIQWFSFQLPLFPAMGDKSVASLVLPSITLALPTGAMIAQLLSRSLATSLGEPYIDTARAKGADRRRVHLRHALRNAALPAITMTGLIIGQLLSGTVVTETVFSRPGIGRVTASAVQQQDIPVVQGIVLFAAAAFVLANLTVDLVYPFLDPRIQLTTARRRRRAPVVSRTATTTATADDGVDGSAVDENDRSHADAALEATR